MSIDKYILAEDGKTPLLEPDLMKWAMWFEKQDNRRVGWHEIGPYRISTVFLGTDHNFLMKGPPVLWETMIFGPPAEDAHGVFSDYMERYTSYEQALEGHKKAVRMVSAHCN